MFNEYLKKLSEADGYDSLKNIISQVMKDETISKQEKHTLVELYKTQKYKVNREYLNTDRLYSCLYYLTKKCKEKEIGKLLYELKERKVINDFQGKILFDLYKKGNTEVEAGIAKTEASVEEDIEAF